MYQTFLMSGMSDHQRTTLKPSATIAIANIAPDAGARLSELPELCEAANPLISAASPLVTLVYGKVLLVLLSLYRSPVGIFEHLPMGSSYIANSIRLERIFGPRTKGELTVSAGVWLSAACSVYPTARSTV